MVDMPANNNKDLKVNNFMEKEIEIVNKGISGNRAYKKYGNKIDNKTLKKRIF